MIARAHHHHLAISGSGSITSRRGAPPKPLAARLHPLKTLADAAVDVITLRTKLCHSTVDYTIVDLAHKALKMHMTKPLRLPLTNS